MSVMVEQARATSRVPRGVEAARWRASLVPTVVSTLVWVVVVGLVPWVGWLVVVACGGYALAWRRPGVLRLVWGLRDASVEERALLLRALVPIASLRGRRQPRVWITRRPDVLAAMPTEHDLVIGRRLLAALVAGRLADEHVAAAVAATGLGQAEARPRRLWAAVEVFCLPATLLGVLLRPLGRLLLQLPVKGLTGVVLGIALVQSAAVGQWGTALGVAAVAAAAWVGPRWSRAAALAVQRVGDVTVAEHGLGEAWLQVQRWAGGKR